MMNILAILLGLGIIGLYVLLAPYFRFFVRILPRMLFDDLTEADKRGIVLQAQALARRPLI